jgi:hypothetical protein
MDKIVESINTSPLLLKVHSIMPGISGPIDAAVSAPPSTDKTQIAHEKTIVPIQHTATGSDYSAVGAVRNQEITSAISPAVSELRLFRRLPPNISSRQ